MKVIKRFKRTLDRKVYEGTLISEPKSTTLMNRKGELGQNLPPKFGIETGAIPESGLREKKKTFYLTKN